MIKKYISSNKIGGRTSVKSIYYQIFKSKLLLLFLSFYFYFGFLCCDQSAAFLLYFIRQCLNTCRESHHVWMPERSYRISTQEQINLIRFFIFCYYIRLPHNNNERPKRKELYTATAHNRFNE